MHHTIDKLPDTKELKKYLGKRSSRKFNRTSKSFKPVKIKKNENLKKYETWK